MAGQHGPQHRVPGRLNAHAAAAARPRGGGLPPCLSRVAPGAARLFAMMPALNTDPGMHHPRTSHPLHAPGDPPQHICSPPASALELTPTTTHLVHTSSSGARLRAPPTMDPAPAGGASENTPLIDAPGEEPGPARPPVREKSGTHPFYGALKRTNDVARLLANPWPKARGGAVARWGGGAVKPPHSLAPLVADGARAPADIHIGPLRRLGRPPLRLRQQRHCHSLAGACPRRTRQSTARAPCFTSVAALYRTPGARLAVARWLAQPRVLPLTLRRLAPVY